MRVTTTEYVELLKVNIIDSLCATNVYFIPKPVDGFITIAVIDSNWKKKRNIVDLE